jgi:general secretion pathway protein K
VTNRRRKNERGAALLVAIISVAVLTAVAVSLAYESRVSLRIAANARDELRASYLARSGVTLSRLVLSFQQSIDDLGGAQKPAGISIPRVQLWHIVPVESQLASALFGGGGAEGVQGGHGEGGGVAAPGAAAEAGAAAAPAASPLRSGTFEALIDDEARKINVQFDGYNEGASAIILATRVQALYHLVCDAQWDPLFEREDANGIRTTREELLVYLRDWVDEGSSGSGVRPLVSGGTPCSMIIAPTKPFDDAFGDENQPYDRGDDRYKTKNARMDSLDELFMVAGVGDAFMAAFGDALTVYLPRDGAGAKLNVNELDANKLFLNANLVADPPFVQPVLRDPEFKALLQRVVFQQTLGGMLAMSVTDFITLVQGLGVKVKANLLQQQGSNQQNNPFTDRSTTFRIRSSGKAGDVTSTIDAVVRLEPAVPTPVAGRPVQAQAQLEGVAAPGRLIHWKEE